MIASMTGFARAEASVSGGALVCELRSVNHRFLEASLRLPEELRSLDPDLRAQLQKDLRRGKTDVTFTWRGGANGERPPELDHGQVAKLRVALDELVQATRGAGAPMQLNLVDLLRFPGVLREQSHDPEALLHSAREVFGRALADLKAMRLREGARLREVLLQRCASIEGLVRQVRDRLPEVRTALRTRWLERIAELQASIDAERLEQELALLAQKMDVAEELDRLDGHLTEARSTLDGAEAAGRRLDFLMQEFNREANTLSSKSQDLATTRIAVELKVLIEQMREQVQNVE